MTTIYLASRYSRRLELCGYREELLALGHDVTARWLNGEHQVDNEGVAIGEGGEQRVESGGDAIAAKFAQDDFEDVATARLVIAFTEVPRGPGGSSRGGRHVELGMALAWAKDIIVVGPRENVFCWLPCVDHFETWEGALDSIPQVIA